MPQVPEQRGWNLQKAEDRVLGSTTQRVDKVTPGGHEDGEDTRLRIPG